MITQLSNSVAIFLAKKEIVDESEIDIYRYGMEVIFCCIVDYIIVLLSGVIFGQIFEAIFFYCVFAVLRQLSSGYHASTFGRCKSLMIVMMTLAMVIGCINIKISFWSICGSTIAIALLIRNVKLKCDKFLYLGIYIVLLTILSVSSNSLAKMMICAYLVVAITSTRVKGGICNEEKCKQNTEFNSKTD